MRSANAYLNPDQLDWAKGSGLLPAIVQDAGTHQVLMLGYMNEEALTKTRETGLVTFYSRTRQELWQKGETSGNTLSCVRIDIDCDNDTLLIQATPAGPVCHLRTKSCFTDEDWPDTGFLAALERTIISRKNEPAENSYTARLFANGVKRIAQKVGEEGVETALAGVAGSKEELRDEAADLLYHLIVLLQASNISFNDVIKTLQLRHQKTD